MDRVTASTTLLATLLVLGTPLGAAAQTAPPAEAEATAAEIEGVAAIGETRASADQESGAATGNAVRLGEEPPAEQFGGSQSGQGRSEGATVDTGDTDLGRAQVTPWSAEVSDGDDERTAESDAALVRLTVRDRDTAHLEVLASRSGARHGGSGSHAESETTGAGVMLGGEEGLQLIVLRAFSRSAGDGESGSYLASVNGREIVTSEQADGRCVVDANLLLHLVCVWADGGVVDGITAVSAGVAAASVLDGAVDVAVGTTAATGADEAAVQPAAVPAPPVEPAAAPAPAAAAEPAAGLPVTGLALEGLLALAAGLVLVGGGAIRYRGAAQPLEL